METLSSSEKSVLTRTTRRNIPEDGIFQNVVSSVPHLNKNGRVLSDVTQALLISTSASEFSKAANLFETSTWHCREVSAEELYTSIPSYIFKV
jgi:hypothetical protein